MSQAGRRRRYSTEFKLEAIRQVRARDGRVTEVARSLDIHPNMLHRWIKTYAEEGERAFPGNGNPRDKEIRRLKMAVRTAEEERDILLKSSKLFLKTPAMKFRFIYENKQQHGIGIMCKALSVSRSGYYYWLKNKCDKM